MALLTFTQSPLNASFAYAELVFPAGHAPEKGKGGHALYVLLHKNIENDAVAKMINIYASSEKQSFIAIDEIDKYGTKAKKTLWDNHVVKLDNKKLLYNKDWRGKG